MTHNGSATAEYAVRAREEPNLPWRARPTGPHAV
jgi:hypothetical protein